MLPDEGVELFQAQFVRLNITCSENIAGSLMFKFGQTQTFNATGKVIAITKFVFNLDLTWN